MLRSFFLSIFGSLMTWWGLAIIAALEHRDAERAGRLAREHALGLAAHVEAHGDFLDSGHHND